MNKKVKLISLVTIAVLGMSVYASVALADEVTGMLTVGSNNEATGTLATGLDGDAGSGISGVVVVPPVADPAAGTYTSAQSVVLAASGASSIHYTADGSVPTCLVGTVYSNSIAVGASQTIEAISCYPDGVSSTIASFVYVINIPAPVSSGGGGGGGGGGRRWWRRLLYCSSYDYGYHNYNYGHASISTIVWTGFGCHRIQLHL